jgi:hypothetical protein
VEACSRDLCGGTKRARGAQARRKALKPPSSKGDAASLLATTTVIGSYLGERSYAMLSGLAAAGALVVRTANAPSAAIGEHVAVIRFDLAPGF